ncbi:hypothetical protein GW17_00040552 [Ensete ventricosum]|nr:hypothetical protein GW17_00040552 [Ensete ventricosum]
MDAVTKRGHGHRDRSRLGRATRSHVGLGRAARALRRRRRATADPAGEYRCRGRGRTAARSQEPGWSTMAQGSNCDCLGDKTEEGDNGRWPLAGLLGGSQQQKKQSNDCFVSMAASESRGRRSRCRR